MKEKNQQPQQNLYDDGNIPDIDLPQNYTQNHFPSQRLPKEHEINLHMDYESTEPLPESTRPRQDGPGGGE